MANELAIWLYGLHAATVTEDRGRLRLEYTADARDSFDAGTPLLSLRLPLTTERYPNATVRAFLDGLLPEGDARRAIADDLKLRADDTFGLSRELGRDCAGALIIQPLDSPPPPPATTQRAAPIDDTELADLVANLRSAPLGVSERVRLSLAGVQEKLLLTRLPDGTWGRPIDGTPSTHILKPEIRDLPQAIENEAFCMRIAHYLGLPVPSIETTVVGNRKAIVIERYDRVVDESGDVDRIHQEDFCQATGVPPSKKYQEDGGPSLRQLARILQLTDPEGMTTLLRATTLNVVIGNGDAHAKNFSLLHDRSGGVWLAPLYDLLSTLYYEQKRLAMYVDTVQRIDRVTLDRIINEGISWGMSRTQCLQTVTQVVEQLPQAISHAAQETPAIPPEIQNIVVDQIKRVAATT